MVQMKELDRQAKNKEPMPSGLKGYEQAYYIASRGLYEQYDRGSITLSQARTEKEQMAQIYKQGEEEWNYLMRLHSVDDKLKQLHEQGFNTVLELEILELLDKLL